MSLRGLGLNFAGAKPKQSARYIAGRLLQVFYAKAMQTLAMTFSIVIKKLIYIIMQEAVVA
jgi:hypothetical protein